ncbi:Y-family DNA polymerase [Dongia sedimenti]|uniref:DNA-directed DNA polymerase n=1 Tax=Dongia sedimenti TaxID=3064282 RepID=A0ABU0YPL2_9PROT|nr:DNA polymerase Y family protein [Rhodospirillaceae bacterium R-7]
MWLRFWAADRWRRAHAPADRPSDRPFVLVETVGPRRQVMAADPRALACGIAPGMGVADAQALLPDLLVLPADPAGDLAALHRLAEWATRFSPLVAPDPDDGLMLDITGCAHLWAPGDSGEEKLLADALRRLRSHGFDVTGAIAGTIGGAWAAARFSTGGAIIPAGAVSGALAALPVQALRIDAATADGLQRLGLRKIGDLYPMKRAGLAQRFGNALITRLDQALGCAAETLSPLLPPPEHRIGLGFGEPIAAPEQVRRVSEILVERLARELAEHQRGARALKLSAYRIDGVVSTLAIGTARASAEPRHLFHLIAEKLERIDPGPGIEFMSLAAERTEIVTPLQSGMIDPGLIDLDEAAVSAADLAPLMDRLANRLGPERLARPVPVESHVPERAVKLAAPLEDQKKTQWPKLPPRPTRLLPNPEPIEVMAPVPDDPPITFRWRRILHRVTWAEGPERVAPEWWRPASSDANESQETRDYYRVQDESGSRYWLYRAGLYQAEKQPRWFLHGVFA